VDKILSVLIFDIKANDSFELKLLLLLLKFFNFSLTELEREICLTDDGLLDLLKF